MRVSNNQLNIWHSCQKQWYYGYVEKLSGSKGTSKFDKGLYTHELLHVLYHTMNLGYKAGDEFLLQAMISRMEDDVKSHMDNMEMIKVVMPLIRKFVAKQHPIIDKDIKKILGVEIHFSAQIEDLEMDGYIDLIYEDQWGRIIVRDHKSSEQINSWSQAKVDSDQQLLMYCAAASIFLKRPVNNVEINFLNTYPYKEQRPITDLFKVFKAEYDPRLIAGFTDNLLAVHNQMVNGPHHRNFSSCQYCPYRAICMSELKGISVELTKASMRKVDEKPAGR